MRVPGRRTVGEQDSLGSTAGGVNERAGEQCGAHVRGMFPCFSALVWDIPAMLIRGMPLLLMLLLVGPAWGQPSPPESTGQPTPPDSTGQLSPPDSAGQLSPPDSSVQVPVLQVFLKSGEVIQAVRVMQNSLAMVTVTQVNGKDTVVTANEVRAVMDERGRDRTHEVMVDSKVLRVGDPDPGEEEKKKKKKEVPAGEKGAYLSVHVGAASPVGEIGTAATTGFGLDASVHWRRGGRYVHGVRLAYTQFGGAEDVEQFFSEISAGAVDQLKFRAWGASYVARWLVFRGPRVDPFIQYTLGLGGFTTSLSGPGASGTNTVFALPSELAIGLHVRTSNRTGIDILTAYTSTGTGDSKTEAGDFFFTSSGSLHALQFKVGFVRRYGGGE